MITNTLPKLILLAVPSVIAGEAATKSVIDGNTYMPVAVICGILVFFIPIVWKTATTVQRIFDRLTSLEDKVSKIYCLRENECVIKPKDK